MHSLQSESQSKARSPGPSTRLANSVTATASGWLAATLATLPFEVLVLWRNAAPGELARSLAEGIGLWVALTLALCTSIWILLVLPVALALPSALVVRLRWLIIVIACSSAVYTTGWKLGIWEGLTEKSADPPLAHPLFWEYALFSITLTLVTTLRYTRSMQASTQPGA